jgi:superoxide dismutase, Fe-Mn family
MDLIEGDKFYSLPRLAYGYKDLEPHISEEQLMIHHQKHHQAYVNAANMILEKLEKSRKEDKELDLKALLKEFSFHLGGHILHSLFWENLAPESVGGGKEPEGKIREIILEEFKSFERFKKEFSQVAMSIEGSGWTILTFDSTTQKPMLMQVEKHNVNLYPKFPILLALDCWEHAYYLDYKNDKTKFIESFWKIINWSKTNQRLEEIL